MGGGDRHTITRTAERLEQPSQRPSWRNWIPWRFPCQGTRIQERQYLRTFTLRGAPVAAFQEAVGMSASPQAMVQAQLARVPCQRVNRIPRITSQGRRRARQRNEVLQHPARPTVASRASLTSDMAYRGQKPCRSVGLHESYVNSLEHFFDRGTIRTSLTFTGKTGPLQFTMTGSGNSA